MFEAMMEEVRFKCPQCGKIWYEMQSPEDDWFKLGTNQCLCKECGDAAIKKFLELRDQANEILSRRTSSN